MDIDELINNKEIGKSKAEKRMIEQIRLSKMPFHLRIQEKSMKFVLNRIHTTQKGTFQKICKRDKIHKEDWEDEFCLFWIDFLAGKCKSINQYLKRKNFK